MVPGREDHSHINMKKESQRRDNRYPRSHFPPAYREAGGGSHYPNRSTGSVALEPNYKHDVNR